MIILGILCALFYLTLRWLSPRCKAYQQQQQQQQRQAHARWRANCRDFNTVGKGTTKS